MPRVAPDDHRHPGREPTARRQRGCSVPAFLSAGTEHSDAGARAAEPCPPGTAPGPYSLSHPASAAVAALTTARFIRFGPAPT